MQSGHYDCYISQTILLASSPGLLPSYLISSSMEVVVHMNIGVTKATPMYYKRWSDVFPI